VARCEVDILHDVVMRGTGKRAALFGQAVAGKTGTTDEQSDAWFLGLTPQLAGAVWMGAPDARVPMTNVGGIRVYGGTYPAQIWQAFLWGALRGQPTEPFRAPTGTCQRPAPPPTAAPGSPGPVFDSSGGPVAISSGGGSGGGSSGAGSAPAPPPAPAPRAASAPPPATRSAPPPPAPKPIVQLPKLPKALGV
jgi:penicillin-binding protein 1A